jgi:aryl-alcohol dehydrogenase-like predicted oxidoreductase
MSLTALALAFVYSRWFVGSTIVGATSVAQLAENLDAWQRRLDEDTLAEIEQVHQLHANPAP